MTETNPRPNVAAAKENMRARWEGFFAAYEIDLNETAARERAGVSAATIGRWKKEEPEFAERFDTIRATHNPGSREGIAAQLEERVFKMLLWASEPDQYRLLMGHTKLIEMFLKAWLPDRYADKGDVVSVEATKLMDKLAALSDTPPVHVVAEGGIVIPGSPVVVPWGELTDDDTG